MTTTQPALVAFHGQPAIKDEYLARVEAHRAAADFTRDPYAETAPDEQGNGSWRGGASHVTFHKSRDPHEAGELQIGLPIGLARLLDELFMKMAAERYAVWPGQFLAAIPVGADLSRVWPRLAIWLLTDAQAGVIRFAQTNDQRAAVEEITNCYSRLLDGAEVPYKQWAAVQKIAVELGQAADEAARKATAATYSHADIAAIAAAATAQAASYAIGAAASAATAATDARYLSGAVSSALDAAGQAALAGALADQNPASADDFIVTYSALASMVIATADLVADKLLALLAAAPVPPGRASGKRLPRALTAPVLVAFHGEQATKEEYLSRLEAHRAAGDIVRNPFGEMYYGHQTTPNREGTTSDWRGGASGCAFHDNHDPHHKGELEIGVPRALLRLLDAVFVGLPPEQSAAWPGRFLAAIPVGADLSRVWPQLAGWLLTDAPASMLSLAQTADQQAAIQAVANLYAKVRSGKRVAVKTWLSAYQTATAAAASVATAHATAAAYTATVVATYATSVAAYAAVAAAGIRGSYSFIGALNDAYASAIGYAATATARLAAGHAFPTRYLPDAAAYEAAASAYHTRLADELLTLLAAAPVAAPKRSK